MEGGGHTEGEERRGLQARGWGTAAAATRWVTAGRSSSCVLPPPIVNAPKQILIKLIQGLSGQSVRFYYVSVSQSVEPSTKKRNEASGRSGGTVPSVIVGKIISSRFT